MTSSLKVEAILQGPLDLGSDEETISIEIPIFDEDELKAAKEEIALLKDMMKEKDQKIISLQKRVDKYETEAKEQHHEYINTIHLLLSKVEDFRDEVLASAIADREIFKGKLVKEREKNEEKIEIFPPVKMVE